jgi:hypothetical protein
MRSALASQTLDALGVATIGGTSKDHEHNRPSDHHHPTLALAAPPAEEPEPAPAVLATDHLHQAAARRAPNLLAAR